MHDDFKYKTANPKIGSMRARNFGFPTCHAAQKAIC